ncbi:MAG: ankyrin repeat domain-containing protein [Armatimonadota bacterium]|nr:ankyrin repeat domain-containing protein [Armatimonadota bacterium]
MPETLAGPPLHQAVAERDAFEVQVLIARGEDVNAVDKWGYTPLLLACTQTGDQYTVTHPDSYGRLGSPQEQRWANQWRATVDNALALIKAGAKVNVVNPYGWTPLEMAFELGSTPLVEAMVKAGADPNRPQKQGPPPLHRAIALRDEHLVDLLLQHGADPNALDSSGATPLYNATQTPAYAPPTDIFATPVPIVRGSRAIASLIRQHGGREGTNALFDAIDNGNLLEVQRALTHEPALLHSRDQDGRSPLSRAVFWGNRAVVELLLQKSALVQTIDDWGNTPLHIAATAGDENMMEFLLAHGANINTANDGGATPLYEAIERGENDTVNFLLESGASVTTRGLDGSTPLHAACRRGSLLLCQALLAKGADVNAGDWKGNTPLSLVTTSGNRDLADLFLKYVKRGSGRRSSGAPPNSQHP